MTTASPAGPVGRLGAPAAFFSSIRASAFRGRLSPGQVEGMEALLAAAGARGWRSEWAAYLLGTVHHETGEMMLPVTERGGVEYFTERYEHNASIARRLGNIKPGDGAKYCGKGAVQITGRDNYAKMSARLGVDLVNAPHLALDKGVSARVAVVGMEEGLFTGRKLADYFKPGGPSDWINARRIINGTDRAAEIATLARAYLTALQAGQWVAR